MSGSQAHREYFYGIDAVRFAAAAMVALFHLGRSINSPGSRGFPISQGLLETSVSDHVRWASVGVEIFFVVSGLVIANSANGTSPFRFLRSRVERLYPAVWICGTISFLIWTVNGRTPFWGDLALYLKSLTLFPFGAWIDGPYWTLGHEVIFYIVIGLVLLAGRIRNLEWVAVALAGISGLFWMGRALVALDGWSLPVLHMFETGPLRFFFPIFGGHFALGIFLWLHHRRLMTGVGRCFAISAMWGCFAPYILGYVTQGQVSPPFYGFATGLVAIVIASRFPSSREREGRAGRWLRVAGLATYPLYLIHFALGAYIMRRMVDAGFGADAALVVALAVVTALAIIIATGPERRVRALVAAGFDWLEDRQGQLGRVVRKLSLNNEPIAVNR